MESLKLVEYAEAIGHELSLEGDNLRIAKGKYLPGYLKQEIINHKADIIEAMRNDLQAKEIGLMIGITGSHYMWTVSRFSTAYMQLYNGEWVAWRETYQEGEGKQEPISHKVIARGNTFDYVLQEFQKYMKYISRNWNL